MSDHQPAQDNRECAAGEGAEVVRARALIGGRIDILFRLGRHYLFLPFAALCVAATLMGGKTAIWIVTAPLILQIVLTVAAERLAAGYARRSSQDDPLSWARRYTILSGLSGAVWGVGALIWFVPGSFPAQCYLSLAFLGITATEFIARSAYRPAYLAHASLSLVPLAIRLMVEGDPYATLTSILVLFFGGILYSYCDRFTDLLDEAILLRHENAGLVEHLSREKKEAERARDVAEAGMRAKTSFIANISHEIRTPLNALLGMGQLLERSDLDRTQRGYVNVILEAGRGLKTLLDDVIALSRDDNPSGPADEDCDAAQAARTVSRLLQPRAWEKNLRLTVSAPANLPRVAADPRRVRQVLLRLADNAVKFTERGGVEIRVEPLPDDSGAQMLRFSVIDTGLGLPPEFADNLFQPFTPGDNSYTKRHEGAGLGLAVAKRTVDALDGRIGFESTPGEGATFWFTVPAVRVDAPQRQEPVPIASDTPPPSGLVFLVALAEGPVCGQIAGLLEPFGNRLTFAATVSDALVEARGGGFDAIIATAADADSLAAAPGVSAPVLALLSGGMRMPAAADEVLRWPAPAGALYRTLGDMLGRAADAGQPAAEAEHENTAAIDASAFAALEKSLGLTTLIEILQSYAKTAEDLSTRLEVAGEAGNWEDGVRVAQDIAGAAGGLGLSALTAAARAFTQKVREGATDDSLRSAVATILSEHARVRSALAHLYPDLAA
ncbi:MAG: hypothetical protein KGR48_15180 [Alphaproteobacteria bacterium]|nr:hypothetical protein [Alphaproteobacteria bacterium]